MHTFCKEGQKMSVLLSIVLLVTNFSHMCVCVCVYMDFMYVCTIDLMGTNIWVLSLRDVFCFRAQQICSAVPRMCLYLQFGYLQ